MRFRTPELFLGCFLTIAVFAMGMTFRSSPQQPNKGQSSASQQRAENKGATDRKETQSLWMPTDSVGLYTLVLCGFTGILAIVSIFQGAMLLRADKTTRMAANAADLSARAAIGLELPIIRMTPDSLGSGAVRDGDNMTVSYSVGSVVFANFGRTKAFPVEIKCGMTLGENLAVEPNYSSVETFLPNIVFEPPPPKPDIHTTPRLRLSDCSVVVQDDTMDEIRMGETNLWFYCCLAYNDFMDIRREVRSCWQWTNVGRGMGWRADATPAYNRKS